MSVWVVCCGWCVVCSGSGVVVFVLWSWVSKLGQKSDNIGSNSVENRSKIDQIFVLGHLGTILGRGSRPNRLNGEMLLFSVAFGGKGDPKWTFLEFPQINRWQQQKLPGGGQSAPVPVNMLHGSGFEKQ